MTEPLDVEPVLEDVHRPHTELPRLVNGNGKLSLLVSRVVADGVARGGVLGHDRERRGSPEREGVRTCRGESSNAAGDAPSSRGRLRRRSRSAGRARAPSYPRGPCRAAARRRRGWSARPPPPCRPTRRGGAARCSSPSEDPPRRRGSRRAWRRRAMRRGRARATRYAFGVDASSRGMRGQGHCVERLAHDVALSVARHDRDRLRERFAGSRARFASVASWIR